MTEEWRPVKDYIDYFVSNWGRIKSLKSGKERILKPGINKGHLQVELRKDGEGHNKQVHRLVAEAFIPNPENKPYVDHIDGNPLNNNVSNLRWATPKENSNNPVTLKIFSESRKGEKNSFYGKTHTEETKRKISKASTGRKHTEEIKRKISEACKGEKSYNYGKNLSEDTRHKISKKHGGLPIICFKNNEIIKIYLYLCDVKKDGFDVHAVWGCCNGFWKSHKGHQFRYATEEDVN